MFKPSVWDATVPRWCRCYRGATIKGHPVQRVLSSEQIQRCVEGTVGGGGAVVSLRRTGSAYLAPGHATCEVLDGLRGQRAGAIPVSVLLEGEYGMEGMVLGVPALLGKGGLIEVVEMTLSQEEQRALETAGRKSAPLWRRQGLSRFEGLGVC